MDIRLSEIKATSDFELFELRERAQESSKSKNTMHCRAIKDGQEVAFVSLDRWYELGHIVLYEIHVAKDFRRQGIGNAILAEVETTSMAEGLLQIRLCPRPLDQDFPQESLVAWYARRGYKLDSTTGDMQKRLPNKV